MFQYLENTTKASKNYWQIELNNQKNVIKYGIINETEEIIEQVFEDEILAFQAYKSEVVKKLQAGYVDPKGLVKEANFLDHIYDAYLAQNQFEEAIRWLSVYPNLVDPSYEDKLINTCLNSKNYTIAEKYVLEKIQVVKDANIIIRQVRYLSLINPMLCRFMIGNLPPDPKPRNELAYYQDLASAQSKIGMFSMISTTLKIIHSDRVKISYLTNLLEVVHKDSEPQLGILEKAIMLLDTINFDDNEKVELYIHLSKGALNIGAQEVAENLNHLITVLKEE